MIVSKALYNYIEAAIEDYFAKGYQPHLSVIADNAYLEFEGLSYIEIKRVAKEVITE